MQALKLKKKRAKERRDIAKRKKLTSRERIAIHRERYGGCGVFHKKADKDDDIDAHNFQFSSVLLDKTLD